MGMPNDLLLVRHGQSDGNVAMDREESGELITFSDEFMTTPGHQWRLTAVGRAQAATAGEWIAKHVWSRFDRYYVSPYVRTRETAALLCLPGAAWRLNRALRERDWGDIGSLPMRQFRGMPQYRLNAAAKEIDPLYWAPPNGESIAQVAEDRVRNVLNTLHRECDEQRVIAVAHGDAMWAFRLVLERMSDEQFVAADSDRSQKIHNCEVLHYTRLDPSTGLQAPRLTWLRRARPVHVGGRWRMRTQRWRRLDFPTLSNTALLEQVSTVPPTTP